MTENENSYPDTFELGLTMAGAVSGGAYTAGVLDYLIEALDVWQAQKEAEVSLPPDQRTAPIHKLVVSAASGASAGSMCSAILGAALNCKFPPVHWDGVSNQNALDGTGNPFFESWVKKIRIEDLLKTDDIGKGLLPSLLNSQPIDRILNDVLNFNGTPATRPWVANPFVTRFGVTNLRGVSYDVGMKGNTSAGHQMRVHTEHLDFKVAAPSGSSRATKLPELDAATVLAARPSPTDKGWANFGAAALASGAFPFALKPRRLERQKKDYDEREWVDVSAGKKTAPASFIKPNPLNDPYGFYCMDGGLTDNEPFELARQVLTGSPWDTNPRDGDKAYRAVVMIDPFVEDAKVPEDEAGRAKASGTVKLQEFIMPMLDAWKMQCRFKPAELALSHHENVYSRYLIAPSRGDKNPLTHPLAAGGLGAFLGFCHESFRIHDYLLGRRNCQQFLQQHFTLPKENSIIQIGYFDDHGNILPGLAGLRASNGEWPIIPVVGSLASREEVLPSWPAELFKPEILRKPLEARIGKVLVALSDEATGSMGLLKRIFVRAGLAIAKYFGKKEILDAAIEAMNSAVREQKL